MRLTKLTMQKPPKRATPEVLLWQAVVVQVVADALTTGNPKTANGKRAIREAQRARTYMQTSSAWREVCARAGTTPEYIARLFTEMEAGERVPFYEVGPIPEDDMDVVDVVGEMA